MLDSSRAFTPVASADGTPIAVESIGGGPPLVIIGGALSNRATMLPLAEALADTFTATCYDRRGRGDSGDAETYAVEREIDDLRAVIDLLGGEALVYGHSSGAALALRAAAVGAPITRLALWEPPMVVDPDRKGHALAVALRAGYAAGGHARLLEEFLVLALRLSPDALARAKAGATWDQMTQMAPTLLYDMVMSGADGTVPLPPLDTIAIPVLSLAGGASPSGMRDGAARVSAAITGARCAAVADQQHNPSREVLAPILTGFFTTPNL
jgi:pimeloyl-ACP methyl ester carboxylesterase